MSGPFVGVPLMDDLGALQYQAFYRVSRLAQLEGLPGETAQELIDLSGDLLQLGSVTGLRPFQVILGQLPDGWPSVAAPLPLVDHVTKQVLSYARRHLSASTLSPPTVVGPAESITETDHAAILGPSVLPEGISVGGQGLSATNEIPPNRPSTAGTRPDSSVRDDEKVRVGLWRKFMKNLGSNDVLSEHKATAHSNVLPKTGALPENGAEAVDSLGTAVSAAVASAPQQWDHMGGPDPLSHSNIAQPEFIWGPIPKTAMSETIGWNEAELREFNDLAATQSSALRATQSPEPFPTSSRRAPFRSWPRKKSQELTPDAATLWPSKPSRRGTDKTEAHRSKLRRVVDIAVSPVHRPRIGDGNARHPCFFLPGDIELAWDSPQGASNEAVDASEPTRRSFKRLGLKSASPPAGANDIKSGYSERKEFLNRKSSSPLESARNSHENALDAHPENTTKRNFRRFNFSILSDSDNSQAGYQSAANVPTKRNEQLDPSPSISATPASSQLRMPGSSDSAPDRGLTLSGSKRNPTGRHESRSLLFGETPVPTRLKSEVTASSFQPSSSPYGSRSQADLACDTLGLPNRKESQSSRMCLRSRRQSGARARSGKSSGDSPTRGRPSPESIIIVLDQDHDSPLCFDDSDFRCNVTTNQSAETPSVDAAGGFIQTTSPADSVCDGGPGHEVSSIYQPVIDHEATSMSDLEIL